jgi:hypothetical protein
LGKRRHELEDDIENLRAQKCHLQDDVLGLRLRYQSTTAKIHTLEEECDEMEKKKEALENDPKVYGAQFFLKPSQTPRTLAGADTISHIFQILHYHYLPQKKDLEGHRFWRKMEQHLGMVEIELQQVQAQYYLWGPRSNPQIKKQF